MFKVIKKPTFTHEVKISTPVDGGFKEETVKATYAVLGTSEAKNHDLDTAEGSLSFLRAVVRKIDDLFDEAGQAISYNDEIRDALFDTPYVRRALADGYFAGLRGAKTGN